MSRVALLLVLLLLGGCRGEAPPDDLPVESRVSVAPTPPIVGPNRLVITLTDPSGSPQTAHEVRVEGTMTHAGMVPVHANARDEGEGRWVVPDFEFTMGGDWILILRITLPGGEEAERRHDLRVVSSSSPDPGGP